jgi:hypothetical protein
VKRLLLLILTFFILTNMAASRPIIIERTQSDWTCYDYSVNFTQTHPGWGCVTISDNKCFQGISHIVNYKVIDQNTLRIHDEFYNADYLLYNWKISTQFFHFWVESSPIRNYIVLQDNREIIE